LLVFLSPIQALDSVLVKLLAIFVSPRAIFFRRHILDPGLKLLIILSLIMLQGNVYWLSIGYVAAGALGVTIYSAILIQHLRKEEFWKHFSRRTISFPLKEVFGFSFPLLTANFVFLIRNQLVIVFLEYFGSTLDVAAFRAVQPVGDLNTVVIQSFAFLFMPMMARMFAREDQKAIDDLYWQSAIWIALISFPIFLLTFSLAQPLTVLLFGERYAESGVIMAVLAFGYYFNAALGFNADTLRIYGRLRYTVSIDFLAMLISVSFNLVLIPRYGAIGAATGTCVTLVLYNILNHIGLKFGTRINLFEWHYLRVYISIVLGTLGLTIFQILASPPIYVGIVLAGLVSLIVLVINRNVLNIEQTFPELLRFRFIRLILTPHHSKERNHDE
jgi:O-antigen/teichoic acid export membrane protein